MNSFLFPILSAIASIGLYFFFIAPNIEAISELQIKDETFTASLQDVREIESIIAKLETTYAGIGKDDLLKLERFLPEDIDKTQLVSDISRLLLNEGIQVGAIKLNDVKQNHSSTDDKLFVNRLEVNIDFYSNYSDFKNVLLSFEDNLQIAKVKSIRVSPPGKDSDFDTSEGLTKYELELVFYSYNYTEQ